MNRRSSLKGTSAPTLVAAGGGAWHAHDRGEWQVATGPAYEPWSSWRGDPREGALALVRAGVLSSNLHNTQPWIFRVHADRLELFADTSRHLGSFDAFRREMYLGLGCALENMMLAAEANGYTPRLHLDEGSLAPPPPDDAAVPVATIHIGSRAPKRPREPSPLYEAIPERHTNRGPYVAEDPVPADVLDAFRADVEREEGARLVLVSTPRERARFGKLIVRSTEQIISDPEMIRDSERWYRHSRKEVEEHRDGPTLDAAGLPPLGRALAKLLPNPSATDNHRYWFQNTRDVHVATAPLFGMIVVDDIYGRVAQTLRAGRAWQRIHLRATTRGIAMQPLNQPVEIVDRERSLGGSSPTAGDLARFIGPEGGEPTFVFRAGRPAQTAPPSPRRPIGDVVL